jgi:hypothetical protein
MKRDKQLMHYLLLQTRDGKPPAELANYSEEEKVYNAALLIQDGYIHGEALPGPDGKYITAVLQDLTSSGHDLLERMEAQSNQSSATASNEPALSVFISHSSKDIELAEAMTELMGLGIGLTEEDIRCTSVDGYRFEVGAETDAQLKQELKSSKAFIGLITPSSIQSAYVLFELGARWGADLHLAPVLARGAGTESLRGPLKILNALRATEEPQMHQLVQDIARRIGRTPKSPAVYGRALQKLIVAAGKLESAPNQSGSAISKPGSSIPKLVRDDIMKFISKHGSFTANEYAAAAGISEIRAEHFASELVKSALLIDTINEPYGRYFYLTDEGRTYVVSNNLDK